MDGSRRHLPLRSSPLPLELLNDPKEVGDGIMRSRGRWSFGGGLPRVFDQHVRRSIPGYDELHDLCVKLIAQHPGARRILDLGCSTGTLSRRLKRDGTVIVGVDREPGMVAEAHQRDPSGTYICADLDDFDFGTADATFALYVLQFVPRMKRPALLSRLRARLEPGGFLLLAEKVSAPNPTLETKWREEYHAFKRAQGFSSEEIRAKDESLEGVLVPLTERDNEQLLRNAGFSDIAPVFSALCFRAWLVRP